MSHSAFNKELKTILEIANSNEFPSSIILKLYNKIKLHHNNRQITSLFRVPPSAKKEKYFSMPYVPILSEKLEYIFHKFNVGVSFRVDDIMRTLISINLDKPDKMDLNGVYRLTCDTCGRYYIGRTFRPIRIRVKEHLRCLSNRNMISDSSPVRARSTFASHLLATNHNLDNKDPKLDILHSNMFNSTIDTLETFEILLAKHKHSSNLLNDVLDFNCHLLNLIVNLNLFH